MYNRADMARNAAYQQVLHQVSAWPAEDRIALARDLLGTVSGTQAAQNGRPSFERALGIGRGEGPPPTDEQVRQWIDEHRIGKYGQ
jgi:hypothetical protein